MELRGARHLGWGAGSGGGTGKAERDPHAVCLVLTPQNETAGHRVLLPGLRGHLKPEAEVAGTWPALGILWDSRKPDRPCWSWSEARPVLPAVLGHCTALPSAPEPPQAQVRHTPHTHKMWPSGCECAASRGGRLWSPSPFHLPGYLEPTQTHTVGMQLPTPSPG